MLTIFMDKREIALRRALDITDAAQTGVGGADVVHFLPMRSSDCMLIESNGHFALIDSGEGDENPRKPGIHPGNEKVVLEYIKRYCADENGKVTLDFILGTHAHYDHIGNFEAIVRDADITVLKAYFKPFPEKTKSYETAIWKTDETYAAIMDALADEGAQVVHDLPDQSFAFGDFLVTFFNTVTPTELVGKGLNHDTVGVRLDIFGYTMFLAGDFTPELEDLYGDEIGQVDLLKIAHHGYYGPSRLSFLRKLSPKVAVLTNYAGKMYPNVNWNFTVVMGTPVLSAQSMNGVAVAVSPEGVSYYRNTAA
ncbi:MAG: MBL fold metallo-hydrolase [Clostridia bacterium]|nr:MBL fold metallo-hydrolase [Clostridia bacterium]